MAPKPKVVEVQNQATGFAEKFMEALASGNLSSLGYGGYATPLQRGIGGAYESLISQGPQFFDVSPGFDALRERFALTSATGRANAAEKFSIGGSRYGTAAATGIGRYQAESDANQNMLMADLAFKSWTDAQNRFLSTLGGAGGFSMEALTPFLQMAQAGIVNPAVFMQENPWVSGAKAIGGLAQGVGAIAGGFGGAPTTTNVYG